MSRREMAARGWEELDILLVSGDAYVDHPAFGIPLLGRLLESEGYRVGIIAQPDWKDPEALRIMGRPRLFAAVSAGAMDSMVNHYTAAKKIRSNDAYTPGGRAGGRPNRAVIAYTAALKGAFKGLGVVIGGIEASLRRLAHYDYWDDRVRRSVLVDSKADLLVFGMGETPLLEIARRVQGGESLSSLSDISGTAHLSPEPPEQAVVLPSFEEVSQDPARYGEAFRLAAGEANPYSGRVLAQQHGPRWVVVQPPAASLDEVALDRVYGLPFQKLPHPSYHEAIPAYEQIRFSITTHRGCFGGCAFCAITHHQGKQIQSRSEQSVLDELERLADHPEFRGTVTDIGGPTANMYGLECGSDKARRTCRRAGCLYPRPCRHLVTSGRRAAQLLGKVRRQRGVKHAYVASGIRYDLMEHQQEYFEALLEHHVGGLLKVAPESASNKVTRVMRKPGPGAFEQFLAYYRQTSGKLGLRQGVVPYFIAGHPGSTLSDMVDVALFLKRNRLRVEQVQEFTPTPGTLATCMYHTGCDPFTGEPVNVPRSPREKRLQKALLLWHLPEHRQDVLEALRRCGRQEDGRLLLERRRGGN
ncbi:UPF0313 protein [Desulfuromonas versatilis]|uniref:UPF0313 protein n=1 Tax=Desulfuromonas versatilis TaxID=2802975 RepID=A0ABM8HXY0_9BACT|nr:YgiQ family radical SAM protein [Desulfuromonas versatilis]BCR05439.1 UPF0313 protein [Desulfuromonas versatilis]